MKLTKAILGSALLVSSLIFTSCSEDEDVVVNGENEAQLSQAEVQSLLETEDVISVVDTALTDLYNQAGGTLKSSKNECYSAEYTDNGFTATFNNCVLNGTENVNGTLVVTYSASEQSVAYTASFTDFYVGDIRIVGTRTYEFNAEDPESALSFSVTSNISVELADGSTLTESGTKTFAILFEEGQDTLFNLSGEWTVTLDGNTYGISGSVSKQLNCEYWSSGVLDISKNGLAIDVDFGDGTCDNKATVIYPNGATEEIDL
ncbi:hypothetical protein [Croceivirga thetidis]|uniref:Lipoprotein n=1 Tax=Croceivirga thetidis TaxID=2721623 RepID=A0ABX1GRW2_9FLAO|nr:hypothetical protein [Croceivirga thetidis]NKI32329.1 hypothetical protein [Croceivirga thetidis]